MLNILIDQQILLHKELFSPLGHIDTYSDRDIPREQLEKADVLITRSTVQVNEKLLAGTPIKFVGTCTIGIDHFDTDYLNKTSIEWTNAPGCNADSVVQYVISAMASLYPDWLQSKVGIVACGNIGKRVYQRLKNLGLNCCCYDPFLSNNDVPDLVSLDEVLACDVITLHAPLTLSGEHPTHHLISYEELKKIRPGSLLISAGRGGVINNQALVDTLKNRKDFSVALDVWENEPDINTELLRLVDIATPHIAGHSLEGKENGTVMVYHSLCDFLNISPPINVQQVVTQNKKEINVTEPKKITEKSQQKILNQLLLEAYNIQDDHHHLIQKKQALSIAEHFDFLRKNYPIRREYNNCSFPDWIKHTSIDDILQNLC